MVGYIGVEMLRWTVIGMVRQTLCWSILSTNAMSRPCSSAIREMISRS